MTIGVGFIFTFSFFISAPFCFAESKQIFTNYYQVAPDRSEDSGSVKNWFYPDQINRSRHEDYPDLPDNPIEEGHLSLNLPIFSDPIQFYPEPAQSETGERFKRHATGQIRPDTSGPVWNGKKLEDLFKIYLQRKVFDAKDDNQNALVFPGNGQDYPRLNRRDGLKVLRLRKSEKTSPEQLQDQQEIEDPGKH